MNVERWTFLIPLIPLISLTSSDNRTLAPALLLFVFAQRFFIEAIAFTGTKA